MTKYEPFSDETGVIGTVVSPEVSTTSLLIHDASGTKEAGAIVYKVVKPELSDGTLWDQTHDAANNIRYAVSLNLPSLGRRARPRLGRAIIVGGAPSIKDQLEKIRELAADKNNAIFALNWSHTWLIENGIIPRACVFFEIDAEPDSVLEKAHPDVNYFICSHCDPRTFDALKGFKRIVWHSPPNSPPEVEVFKELDDKIKGDLIGGGVSTFTRTISVGLFLGYRHFDVFGCDSSYPDDEKSHVDGYNTIMDSEKDALIVYAQSPKTGEVRRYKTMGYLAYQQEEFKQFCNLNHAVFSMKVYGESLLKFTHEDMYPDQYHPDVYES